MSARDIPIIFSAPMVRALLEGRKTMTRRLAWKEIPADARFPEGRLLATAWQNVKPGDRLWVRENFAEVGTVDPGWLVTQADYPDCAKQYGFDSVPATLREAGYKWRPSIHMPRRLSRLTLIVTATKIERLNDISEKDATAEGILYQNVIVGAHGSGGIHCEITADRFWNCAEDDGFEGHDSAGEAFEDLWVRLHGADAWRANPEVVALTFRVIHANIDATEALAA